MLELKSQKDTNQFPPIESGIRDKIKDKTAKLAAAVYLVTNFLDNMDHIKWKLREKSLDLKVKLITFNTSTSIASVGSAISVEAVLSDITEIISLIDIAVLDHHASVMNFSILRDGYLGLQHEFQSYLAGDWYKNALIQTSKTVNLSHQNPKKVQPPIGSRTSSDDRRGKILSFFKQHNWSSIKDVAKFLPDVGSKTIQRELAELIRTGTLKKTGERRWSRYGIDV